MLRPASYSPLLNAGLPTRTEPTSHQTPALRECHFEPQCSGGEKSRVRSASLRFLVTESFLPRYGLQ